MVTKTFPPSNLCDSSHRSDTSDTSDTSVSSDSNDSSESNDSSYSSYKKKLFTSNSKAQIVIKLKN